MSRLRSHIWSHSASKCGTSLLLKRRDRKCSDRAIMLLIIVNCVKAPAPLETRSFTEIPVTGLLIQFSRHAEIKLRAGDHGGFTNCFGSGSEGSWVRNPLATRQN